MQFHLKNLGNVVNSNPNDLENPPEYITDEFFIVKRLTFSSSVASETGF